jgi:hypothetical protein
MLNNISWASYVFATSIFLLVYYSFVLILYYQYDLQNVFQKIKSSFSNTATRRTSLPDKQNIDSTEKYSADEMQDDYLQDLLFTLQSLIKNGASRNFPKEELLLSLQLKLQQYPALNDNTNKEKINHFIKTECINYCSIHLSSEEVSALWIK